MSTSSIMIRPALGHAKPGQHAQQRGLAAAGGADQGEHLALVNPQIDAVDRGERAECLVDALDDDLRFRVRIEPGPVSDGFRRRRPRGLELRRRRRAAPFRREKRTLDDLRSRHPTFPYQFTVQVDFRPHRRADLEVRRIDHSKGDVALASRRPNRGGDGCRSPLAACRRRTAAHCAPACCRRRRGRPAGRRGPPNLLRQAAPVAR